MSKIIEVTGVLLFAYGIFGSLLLLVTAAVVWIVNMFVRANSALELFFISLPVAVLLGLALIAIS